MNTTATNRKIRVLLTAINETRLIPQPDFQRRLIWSNKDKRAFIDTVLKGYPFPEIYIAAGEVNPNTGEGRELLVDGQQRITTLHQYFSGSEELALGKELPPYSALPNEEKLSFLEYEVVVRDLGRKSIDEIREIFKRINSTKYGLNAMEIHNARYEGAFKLFGDRISQHAFFEDNKVFSASETRRMQDIQFVLLVSITVLSTYFNRDDALEDYLSKYNDEFELGDELEKQLTTVFKFIEGCGFDQKSRVWKKADLFTLLVELYRAIFMRKNDNSPSVVSERLRLFYEKVDTAALQDSVEAGVARYHKAAIQATNDRSSRITRGEIIEHVLLGKS